MINLTERWERSIHWKLQTLLREIKEDLNKWRNVSCTWIGRFSTLRYLFSPNWSIDSIQSQSPNRLFFVETGMISTVDMKIQNTQTNQTTMEKKKKNKMKIKTHIIPKFKTYHKATRESHIILWSNTLRSKGREESPKLFTQILPTGFQQRCKSTSVKERRIFLISSAETNEDPFLKKKK